ncbi:MAG: diaminopimelate aminotransferase [Desulfobacteraceae bacterium 4484_190.3]|nr:MAG: diaminopimelate aminotransferase [Desulfobacteraceae bacterium 4484_190.3]
MTDNRSFNKIKKRIDSYRDDMINLQVKLTAIKDIKKFNAPDKRVPSGIRPNIITTIPGKNQEKTVWILTHMDVVPPGELKLWDKDPYEGYVKNGRIYGRGTEDNQQDLVASIYAAKAFFDEGLLPASSIGLVLWLRFKTKGKQCHASRPSLGKNAFAAASHLIVKLNKLYQIFDSSDPIYQPPESTFEPTKKDENIPNINTIPGEDIFYLDCRILPSYNLSDIQSKIRDLADEIEGRFDVSIEITPVQRVQAPSPTPYNAPVVTALQKAIKDVYGIDAYPVGIGGGTIAANFRKKGYEVAVWSKLSETAHQPNENCLIEDIIGNAKVYAHLFLQK